MRYCTFLIIFLGAATLGNGAQKSADDNGALDGFEREESGSSSGTSSTSGTTAREMNRTRITTRAVASQSQSTMLQMLRISTTLARKSRGQEEMSTVLSDGWSEIVGSTTADVPSPSGSVFEATTSGSGEGRISTTSATSTASGTAGRASINSSAHDAGNETLPVAIAGASGNATSVDGESFSAANGATSSGFGFAQAADGSETPAVHLEVTDTSIPLASVLGNETAGLGNLGPNATFVAADHTREVKGILAGELTLLPANETVLGGRNGSAVSESKGRGERTGVTVVGDLEVPLMDSKINHSETLFSVNGTAGWGWSGGNETTDDGRGGNFSSAVVDGEGFEERLLLNETFYMGNVSTIGAEGNYTAVTSVGNTSTVWMDGKGNQSDTFTTFGNMAMPLTGERSNNSDTFYASNETALAMVGNGTGAYGNTTGVETDGNRNGLNDTMAAAVNLTSPLSNNSNETVHGQNKTLAIDGMGNHTISANLTDPGVWGNGTGTNTTNLTSGLAGNLTAVYGNLTDPEFLDNGTATNATSFTSGVAGNLSAVYGNLTIEAGDLLNASMPGGNLSAWGADLLNMTRAWESARNLTAAEGNFTTMAGNLTSVAGNSTAGVLRFASNNTAPTTGMNTTAVSKITSSAFDNATIARGSTNLLFSNSTTLLGEPFLNGTTNLTDLGIRINKLAHVNALVYQLGGSSNMSDAQAWETLCAEEALIEAAHTLTKEEFGIIVARCVQAWESLLAPGNATAIFKDPANSTANLLPFNGNGTANFSDSSLTAVNTFLHKFRREFDLNNAQMWDTLCADDWLTEVAHTMSKEEFDLIAVGCMEAWESKINAAAIGQNATMVRKFARPARNLTESGKLLQSTGSELSTASTEISPTSVMPSDMATFITDSSATPLTTSFTSKASSFLTSTRSSSSMRPRITNCVDDAGFFEMTDDNLEESEAIEWYADWTINASKGPEAEQFKSMGEVRYFGQIWLQDLDYECGIEIGGCTRRPSCNTILKLYPDDEETARRVYFIMKTQATINLVMKSYYEAIHATHTHLAALVKPIVDLTFQKPGFDDQNACALLKRIYTELQNTFVVPFVKRRVDTGKMLKGPWVTDEVQNDSNPLARGKKWLQMNDPHGKEKNMPVYIYEWYEYVQRQYYQDDIGTPTSSNMWCKGLGIVTSDTASGEEKLRNALLASSTLQRKALSESMAMLNKGLFFDDGDMSTMAALIGLGQWNNETHSQMQILSDPFKLEEIMVTRSREAMISGSYLSQKCYMKCTTHPHAHLLCEGYNDWEFSDKNAHKDGTPIDATYRSHGPRSKKAKEEKAMRICPRPDKVCQVECWSQEERGWTMELHGIQGLGKAPLEVNLKEKMKELYEYYKRSGNVDPDEKREVDALASMDDGPTFWLPVCDSDQGYTHIVDFGVQKHGKYRMDQFSRGSDRRGFPISCGNFRSNETVEFYAAMGMTPYKEVGVGYTMNYFYKNFAPMTAALLIEAPLDNFLALCALGIQYPQKDSLNVDYGEMGIRREPSRFCIPVEEETKDMPWFVANLWFCKKSQPAQLLFKIQGASGAIVGLHKAKNHQGLCQRWLATWEGEMMQGSDEVDASQSKGRKMGAKWRPKKADVLDRLRPYKPYPSIDRWEVKTWGPREQSAYDKQQERKNRKPMGKKKMESGYDETLREKGFSWNPWKSGHGRDAAHGTPKKQKDPPAEIESTADEGSTWLPEPRYSKGYSWTPWKRDLLPPAPSPTPSSSANSTQPAKTQSKSSSSTDVPRAWRVCDNKAGLRVGWRWGKMLFRGNVQEVKAAWKFLFKGQEDLRGEAQLRLTGFEGSESACHEAWRWPGGVNSGVAKRGVGGERGKEGVGMGKEGDEERARGGGIGGEGGD